MPRDIPEQRLLLDSYPMQTPMETRYSDMDSYAHLNNGAIGRLYENCRALMHIEVFQRSDLFVPMPASARCWLSVGCATFTKVTSPAG